MKGFYIVAYRTYGSTKWKCHPDTYDTPHATDAVRKNIERDKPNTETARIWCDL
jgi:nitrogen regulatory protein PII-like uncharacterized protein